MDQPEAPTPLHPVEPSGYPLWVEQFALPFVRDFGLFPVLVAIVGHFAVALAPLLLWVFRGHSPVGALGLLIVAIGSWEVISLDLHAVGRPGRLSAVLFSVLALAGVLAWLGDRYGLL